MSLVDSLVGVAPNQDVIVLAGVPSPGVAVVRGADSPRDWDVQKGYGLTGATTIFTGQGLAKFDVDIFCWESLHFQAWKLFSKLTLENPPIGGRPTSMFIQHPQLNDPPLSIGQVVITNVTQWEQDPDGSGMWSRTISFLEYRKPRPALVKPFEGPPGLLSKAVTPVDPELLIIQKNAAQIAALAK